MSKQTRNLSSLQDLGFFVSRRREFYFAYGSNMNRRQMKYRCPNATLIGHAVLKGWRLSCDRVATIQPCESAQVDGALWSITPECLVSLNAYEGFPSLYRIERVSTYINFREIHNVITYIMNRNGNAAMSEWYKQSCREGAIECGVPVNPLYEPCEQEQSNDYYIPIKYRF